MRNLFGRFTMAKKIAMGYLVLLSITLISCLYSIFIFRQSIKTDQLIENNYHPSLSALEEIKRLVVRSHRLTNGWIYQPGDEVRDELVTIHNTGFPEVRLKLQALRKEWPESQQSVVAEVLDEVSYLFDVERRVLSLLIDSSHYFDSEIVEEAVGELDQRIMPTAKSLEIKISSLIQQQQGDASRIMERKYSSFSSVQQIITVSLAVSLLLGATFAVYSTRVVVRPVTRLRQAVLALSNGELTEIKMLQPDDEIGDMIESTNMLVRGLKKTTDFTERIANGQFDEHYESLSNIRALDEALFSMRNSLLAAAQAEDRRNWVVAGLAEFTDSLRSQDVDELGNNIISYLVKYMGAHHGGVFLVNRESGGDAFLECKACYAWGESVKIGRQVRWGEGLAGQCWKEERIIRLDDIPGRSVYIQGGLGLFAPQSALIIPLKLNNTVIGIIEVISLSRFDDNAVEFLERACENAAAALVGAVNASQTRLLLQQSQQQTEQLMAQDEEMRQMLEQSQMQTEQLLRQEDELRMSHKELQEVAQVNTKLLSVISHDIKGPFASIKGLIQLYNQGLVKDKELREHMGNIEKLIAGTDMLFTNILQWSVHYLNDTSHRQSINLLAAVNTNINLLTLQALEKGNRIVNTVPESIALQGEETVVNLLLRNFLSNAIKFTENGTITISARPVGQATEVSVQDTGVGMTEDDMARLFDWENKHSTIGTRSEKGAGVGLLICKEFIESYGGTLHCTSVRDQGTTFSFTIPGGASPEALHDLLSIKPNGGTLTTRVG